jgi:hypothetical protein
LKLGECNPHAEGNMKFAVEVLNGGEALPMGGLYSDNDIVNHCTSEEEKYALWRIKFSPFAQTKEFSGATPYMMT